MDIIYFESLSQKEIEINSKKYQLIFSKLIINNESILLTGYILVNLTDLQNKKIEELCNGIRNLYNDIKFNIDLENKEIHFIYKRYYDFIKEYHIDKVLVNEKNLNNTIYLKILEDYIYNVLHLKINHKNSQINEDSVIYSLYICEKEKDTCIYISNYFDDEILSKNLQKFYDFLISLREDRFTFDKEKFVKINTLL